GSDPIADWHAFANVNNVVLGGEVVRAGTPPGDDGDGITSAVDVQNGIFSNDFSDVPTGGSTWGGIISRAGLTVAISDEPGLAGVRIAVGGFGGGTARIVPCGDPIAELRMDTGDEVIVACGSAD